MTKLANSDHQYVGFYIYDKSGFKPWVATLEPNLKGPVINKRFFTQGGCVEYLLSKNVVYKGLQGNGLSLIHI